MVALGDSLTRAWGSAGFPTDNVAASWATSPDALVQSHFLRLGVQVSGLTASNVAVSGSKVAATTSQADAAVAAQALYVTLLSGTNDVCASSVAGMTSVAGFTTQVRATLTKLSGISGTKILVSSIPDWWTLWNDYRGNPDALAAWSGGGVCGVVFGSATTDADRQAARQRIVDFNSALATVCAEFSSCTFDGGAVHALRFVPTELAFDFFHLSAAGQARLSAVLWAAGPFANPPPAVPVNSVLPAISGHGPGGAVTVVVDGDVVGEPDLVCVSVVAL